MRFLAFWTFLVCIINIDYLKVGFIMYFSACIIELMFLRFDLFMIFKFWIVFALFFFFFLRNRFVMFWLLIIKINHQRSHLIIKISKPKITLSRLFRVWCASVPGAASLWPWFHDCPHATVHGRHWYLSLSLSVFSMFIAKTTRNFVLL